MPTLTVFVVRCAESIDETTTTTTTANDLRLHQQIDPPLTELGYQQAQSTFLQLVSTICENTPEPADRGDANNDGVIDPLRFLSCFAAPLKSCTGTAVLLAAAGLARQDKITWRYTTVETAKSPAAVPVIVANDLARGVPAIQDAGGVETVVAAGLLHTAATDWNDAQPKCPILKVIVQEFKEKTQEFCREWKDDKTVHPPRKVLDVQYLRVLEENGSPWDIQELSPKFNVTIDLLQPTKYLTPRRSGQFHCKLPGSEGNDAFRKNLEITCENGFRECVWKSRQVGCDTVVLIVPPSTLTCIAKDVCGRPINGDPAPCSVLTLLAHVDDANAASGISFEWIQLAQSASEINAPIFPGPVDCIFPPPPDQDPASVPANQWSKFPPPEPEVIPPDYPDLPPFSRALQEPVPNDRSPPVASNAGRGGTPAGRPATNGRGPPPGTRGGGPPPPGRTGTGRTAPVHRAPVPSAAGRGGRGAPPARGGPGRGTPSQQSPPKSTPPKTTTATVG